MLELELELEPLGGPLVVGEPGVITGGVGDPELAEPEGADPLDSSVGFVAVGFGVPEPEPEPEPEEPVGAVPLPEEPAGVLPLPEPVPVVEDPVVEDAVAVGTVGTFAVEEREGSSVGVGEATGDALEEVGSGITTGGLLIEDPGVGIGITTGGIVIGNAGVTAADEVALPSCRPTMPTALFCERSPTPRGERACAPERSLAALA